jgi:hypothetical protein
MGNLFASLVGEDEPDDDVDDDPLAIAAALPTLALLEDRSERMRALLEDAVTVGDDALIASIKADIDTLVELQRARKSADIRAERESVLAGDRDDRVRAAVDCSGPVAGAARRGTAPP